MKKDYHFPKYNTLTNFSNSFLKYYGIPTFHRNSPTIDRILKRKQYKTIVVLVYDGLGTELLRTLLPKSFLKKHLKTSMDTVFPTSSIAPLTSLLSGLNPNEHGLLGSDQYFPNEDKTVNLKTNKVKDTEFEMPGLINKYYSYNSILNMITSRVDVYELLPYGENAYRDLVDLDNKIITLSKAKNPKLIFAYSNLPDDFLHVNGTDSDITKQVLDQLDESTEFLCRNLEDSLVIITSTHGIINSEAITLSDYPDIYDLLSKDISIEGRACAFYVKENKKEDFKILFQEKFGPDFLLFSKEEVLKKHLFGLGLNHANFANSIGDFLAVAITNKYFRYNNSSIHHISMHGGITNAEVKVPIIVYRTKKSIIEYLKSKF